jgi:uracil phosphoribosyltransferase
MSARTWPNVTIIRHPVVQQELTVARDKHTGVEQFRRLLGQIARLMAFEITRDYPTAPRKIERWDHAKDRCSRGD